MRAGFIGVAVLTIMTGLLLGGCAKSDNPVSSTESVLVNLSVGFSKTSGRLPLLKISGAVAVDSIRIDSAVVVLQRIKFESHIDSVVVDTTGEKVEPETEEEMNVTFFGPFVVHIRDTAAINFAAQTLPAGTYDGIKFKIHRLQPGEHHEDSDEHTGWRVNATADSVGYGSSIVVWGAVKKNGTWELFTFKFDGEFEFKIKGNFVITQATSTANIALSFNMGMWFQNPRGGSLLDPTDTSITTRGLFRQAIRHSFEMGRGGRDDNHGGHPDHD